MNFGYNHGLANVRKIFVVLYGSLTYIFVSLSLSLSLSLFLFLSLIELYI